ncbi:hypothetical protein C7N43_07950 [Sphingobacteriales bacterium UPWRP_1]|nr:hypothetical protein B6N25_11470 [Sphingobacteriales bacterium TSM_CSS]PSJ77588.1 hypothetical protein C7N43_07950 [Sphingobacteriales bacterium UPWRP_1]
MQQIYYQEEIDKILDQYLAGKLSAEEVRLLHAKLQKGELHFLSEDEWEQIVLPPDVLHPITHAEKMTEKVLYASAGNDFEWTENRYQKYGWANSRYAVVISLLLGLLLLLPFVHLFLSLGKEQNLVNRYFAPHDMIPVERSFTNPDAENLWHAAVLKYRAGNYSASAASLSQLFAYQLPDAYTDHLYMGICYIGNAQPREALHHLKIAAETTPADAGLQNLVNWYISLAYIQNGNIAAAKPLLEQLSETLNFVYQTRAAKLLSEL